MIYPQYVKYQQKYPLSIKNTFVKVTHKHTLYAQKVYHKSEYKHVGALYRRLKNATNGIPSQKTNCRKPSVYTVFTNIYTTVT